MSEFVRDRSRLRTASLKAATKATDVATRDRRRHLFRNGLPIVLEVIILAFGNGALFFVSDAPVSFGAA
jgi:hypothetical protein